VLEQQAGIGNLTAGALLVQVTLQVPRFQVANGGAVESHPGEDQVTVHATRLCRGKAGSAGSGGPSGRIPARIHFSRCIAFTTMANKRYNAKSQTGGRRGAHQGLEAMTTDVLEIFGALTQPEARENPYPLYARLHDLGQVVPAGPGFVLVPGYDAVSTVLRDPAYQVTDRARLDQVFPAWRDHPSMLMESIISLNPPDHSRIRMMMSGWFTPRRLAELRPAIERMTDQLLDVMSAAGGEDGVVEFMHDFAFLLPVTVICDLIGIPESDREEFRPAARDVAATLEIGVVDEVLAAGDKAARWLHAYFSHLAARRRADPRDDLISALVAISDDGYLSREELLDNLALLLVAGFETTTNLLGNGLQIALARPAMTADLRAGAVPVASFVEEVLRYDSPVQLTSRRAARDTEIRGVPVAAGDDILVMLGAGNRDPRRFTEPDVFNPQRAVSGPLSFGAGPHFCLGAALARLEAAIAFPRLLRRFPALAAAGEPRRREGLVLRGYDALPVTVR
jgi:cytochrome P450